MKRVVVKGEKTRKPFCILPFLEKLLKSTSTLLCSISPSRFDLY